MKRVKVDGRQADRILAALRTTNQRIPDIAAAEGLTPTTIINIANLHGITRKGRM